MATVLAMKTFVKADITADDNMRWLPRAAAETTLFGGVHTSAKWRGWVGNQELYHDSFGSHGCVHCEGKIWDMVKKGLFDCEAIVYND